jgi:ethanolamine transporter EutH
MRRRSAWVAFGAFTAVVAACGALLVWGISDRKEIWGNVEFSEFNLRAFLIKMAFPVLILLLLAKGLYRKPYAAVKGRLGFGGATQTS